MNMRTNNPLCLPTMIAVLGLILTGQVSAQTFTILHSFTGGKDGAWPQGGLILSGNILYGTASAGGSAGNGNTELEPLWGSWKATASTVGGAGNGTVFAVNTDGTC